MNIRPLTRADEVTAKEIWKVCFGDTNAFIDEYFDQMVHYEDTLGYYDGHDLIADLFMLNFHARLSGVNFKTEFLAGCATLPYARKRGLMRELVKSAMLSMRKRGLAVTYLHPFLHAFYRQFGYETVAYIKRKSMKPSAGHMEKEPAIFSAYDKIPEENMHQAYHRYISAYDHAFIRSRERFSKWLRLLFSDQGYAIVNEAEKPVSYALYYMEEGAANVFELVAREEKERELLLDSIPAETVNYFLPSPPDEMAEEFTMMRVLDPVYLLKKLPLKAKQFTLEVKDNFLGEHYNLRIEEAEGETNRIANTAEKADISLTIGELAQAAAGAYVQGSKFEDYFPRQTACFFETY